MQNVSSPLMSIIVPIYNAEGTLHRCVRSLVQQSYSNIEIILVDDGSSDCSLELSRHMASNDVRITVLSHSNHGVAYTRQIGVEHARGDYVTFVDADDYVKSNFVAEMINAAEKNECDIVCCNSIGNKLGDSPIKRRKVISFNEDIFDGYFSAQRYSCVLWASIYKRTLFNNIEFPRMHYAEDTLLKNILFTRAKKILLIPYCGYKYEDNPNGAMSNVHGIQLAYDVWRCAFWVYQFCIKAGFTQKIDRASQNLSDSSFAVLITGSEDKNFRGSTEEQRVILTLQELYSTHHIRNIKAFINLIYPLSPCLISSMLRMYKKIKNRIKNE